MSHTSGRANFGGGGPDDAFWIYQDDDGGQHVCATSAASFLRAVAGVLDGSISASAWTERLLASLRGRYGAMAAADGAWREVAERLAAQPPRVTRLDIVCAAYLAYYAPNGLRFDALSLPAETILPAIDAAVDGPPSELACFVARRDLDPSISATDRAVAVAESTLGLRLRPGEERPRYAEPGPGGPSGPSDRLVLVGVAAAMAFGLWTFLRVPTKTRRR